MTAIKRPSTSMFWPSVVLGMLCCFAGWRQCNPPQACTCAPECHGR